MNIAISERVYLYAFPLRHGELSLMHMPLLRVNKLRSAPGSLSRSSHPPRCTPQQRDFRTRSRFLFSRNAQASFSQVSVELLVKRDHFASQSLCPLPNRPDGSVRLVFYDVALRVVPAVHDQARPGACLSDQVQKECPVSVLRVVFHLEAIVHEHQVPPAGVGHAAAN